MNSSVNLIVLDLCIDSVFNIADSEFSEKTSIFMEAFNLRTHVSKLSNLVFSRGPFSSVSDVKHCNVVIKKGYYETNVFAIDCFEQNNSQNSQKLCSNNMKSYINWYFDFDSFGVELKKNFHEKSSFI